MKTTFIRTAMCGWAFALIALLLGGCSSFNREWKKAASTPTPTDSIQGRWEGRWLSDANGHSGRLRCLISRSETDQYLAHFHANYMKVFRFGYTVPLAVTQSNGIWHFQGEADLGKMAGGVYHYVGAASSTNFHSTYRSKYDHGDFEMTRPAADLTPAN